MLIDEVRKRVTQAMRARDAQTRDTLRVALGELQSAESRQGALTDEQGHGVIRKMVKSNEETLALTQDAAARERLERENEILSDLLPRTLSVEEIERALGPVEDQIKAASNDGQATGVAMKHLKSSGAAVEGKDVAQAVERLRA